METSVDLLRRVETINLGGHAVSAAGFFRSGSSGTFIDPTTLINNAAFPTTGAGLNLFGAFGDFFNAYASVLSTTSRSKLLAKPHITVANNEIGSISSGTRVPIPSNQQSTVVAGGTTSLNSSVEYEEVVLQLDVQPLINSKNEITLNIDQVNDSLGATVNISGNEIPNIDHQLLHTKVTVPNGAILILGGLISESEQKGNTGVPILSKIPVIKYLFGHNNKNKVRRELVILLQARIIESADDIIDVNNSEIQRSVVGPSAELFAQPDRKTDNVLLPTFEKDIPFNQAGAPVPATEPALPPPSTGKKAVRAKGR
jgi:type II secretory pathway component GspD/PulD (secretin)